MAAKTFVRATSRKFTNIVAGNRVPAMHFCNARFLSPLVLQQRTQKRLCPLLSRIDQVGGCDETADCSRGSVTG